MKTSDFTTTLVVDETPEKVFNAIGAKKKKWVIYENAGHESMLRNDPLKWREEMAGFLTICP